MNWMGFAILGGLMLDAISAWIDRHALHVGEHQAFPRCRFVMWGRQVIDRIAKRRADGSAIMMDVTRAFFVMRLPSWDWGQTDYGRRWGWCQRHAVWFSDMGWAMHLVPCDR